MKLRIKGQRVRELTPREIETLHKGSQVEIDLAAAILKKVQTVTLELSRNRVLKLATGMQAAAVDEASKLISTIDNVITQNYFNDVGIDGAQLRATGSNSVYSSGSGLGPLSSSSGGSIVWAELKRDYHNRKISEGFRGGFFSRTGALSNALLRYEPQIINGRFGGVTVSVDPAELPYLAASGTKVLEPIQKDGRGYKFYLGKIRIKIFPDISRALLPGLASRRWIDTGTTKGSMERAMLPPSIAKKLAPQGDGSQLAYRPLVLPITQFFMLIRIPNAIAAAATRYAKGIIGSEK